MDREAFFERNRRELASLYLADPDNPYQQSGRSSGAQRWEDTRRCIADAVDRSGSFLDVGCANGLLLETLARWLAERHVTIEQFGVDFIEGLIELARSRVPAGTFWTANAWEWTPPRRFDFVRTNLEYVLPDDRPTFVAHQMTWVVPGGRFILCHYQDRGTDLIDTAQFLAANGYPVAGATGADRVSVAWTDVV